MTEPFCSTIFSRSFEIPSCHPALLFFSFLFSLLGTDVLWEARPFLSALLRSCLLPCTATGSVILHAPTLSSAARPTTHGPQGRFASIIRKAKASCFSTLAPAAGEAGRTSSPPWHRAKYPGFSPSSAPRRRTHASAHVDRGRRRRTVVHAAASHSHAWRGASHPMVRSSHDHDGSWRWSPVASVSGRWAEAHVGQLRRMSVNLRGRGRE